MRIFIVEDETSTKGYLKQGRSGLGFVTDLASNGVDGLRRSKCEIKVAVRRLRAKVDDPCESKPIRIVRCMDYVLEVPGGL